MKIRLGFVSNSSSSSFMIPSCFLTDEQKEAVFSCLSDGRETKKKINERAGENIYSEEEVFPEKGLPTNKEYHDIFHQMEKNDEWHDWGWDSHYEHNDKNIISGCCNMWNGSIEEFFKRIGIDTTALEIANEGHGMVHMATHPEAVKCFAERRNKQIEEYLKEKEEYEKMPYNEDKRVSSFMLMFHDIEIIDNPYELKDEDFKPLGDNSVQFDSGDGFCYVKSKKSITSCEGCEHNYSRPSYPPCVCDECDNYDKYELKKADTPIG